MEERTFLEHYRICTRYDGSPDEVSRVGAAISYKATDTRSGEPVLLQLIPAESLHSRTLEQVEARAAVAQQLDHVNIAKLFATGAEHGYFVLASEYLQGETADSWIVAHGAMTPDAVLHVALQVVRAVGAAAFYGLSHRALQPSNILIVPGQSPDGGWPLVKLLNFGLAGAELHSAAAETRPIAPAVAPQFASPEQLRNGEIDFRSEMYSLGATMCFLLTGAVPLGPNTTAAYLSHLRRFPRPLRTLLARMLRENPDERPHDPIVFEKEIRNCLLQIERRQALSRKLGLPLAGVIRRKRREPLSPMAQVWRGIVAVALLVVAAAAVGALLFPNQLQLWRRSGEIGVPVGVPDSSQVALLESADAVAPSPGTTASPPAAAPARNSIATTVAQQGQTPAAAEIKTATPAAPATAEPATSAQIAAAGPAQTAAPPAEGPQAETTRSSASADQRASGNSARSTTSARAKSSSASSARKSSSKRSRTAQRRGSSGESAAPDRDHSSVRARVVGTTADGRIILRLPSGRVVFVTPSDTDQNTTPRHRALIQRPYMYSAPPSQYPPDYFPYN
jgi:Protein kinase domain